MITRSCRVLLILVATLAACASTAAEKSFDRRFTVVPGGQLMLDADTGSVTVVGRSANEVVVHAQASGSDDFLARLTISAEQTASGVSVTARKALPGGFHWFDFSGERLRFTIDIPRNYAVELRTSGGNIEVHAVDGPVRARTSGGNIDAADLGGTTALETAGGNVSVADARGALTAHTSGGNVSAEMRSNRGVSLSTSGGDISLSLPKDLGASIDASTSGGRVSSALPLSSTEHADGSHLRGAINGGGGRIELHTSGGDIHIAPLN